MSLDTLLKKNWFFAHPFSTWMAEDEGELDRWFMPPPFLRAVMGDTAGDGGAPRPTSTLIFGKPGSGKTALRIMIERWLAEHVPDALVLRYVEFSNALSSSAHPPLTAHVEELLRLGTISLIAFWQESAERYERLTWDLRAELAGLIFQYYDTMPPETKHLYTYNLSPAVARLQGVVKHGAKALVETYNATISIIKREKIEPTSWHPVSKSPEQSNPYLRLQRFWSLARSMGVSSIWVLIDGVDQAPTLQSGEAIFNALAEILLTQGVMEFRQSGEQVLGFKAFLTKPDDVLPRLSTAGFRRDRVKTETIEWTRKDLDLVLQRRLGYFSNNKIINFDSICTEEAAGTHDRLLDQCGMRPRTLFRMAHEILAVFGRKDDEKADKLDKTSIEEGIRRGLEAVIL